MLIFAIDNLTRLCKKSKRKLGTKALVKVSWHFFCFKRKKIYEQIVMSDPKPIVIYPGGLAVYKYSSMHGKDDLPNQFERRISNSMRFFWKKIPLASLYFFQRIPLFANTVVSTELCKQYNFGNLTNIFYRTINSSKFSHSFYIIQSMRIILFPNFP